MNKKEIQKEFGQSKKGNFKAIDSIGVPHPYCITPKHLSGSGMYLGANEIKEAEKKGAVCDICKVNHQKNNSPILSYDEHKQAVLIECHEEVNNNKELHAYLLSMKEKAIAKNFEGFAFIKAKDFKEKKK